MTFKAGVPLVEALDSVDALASRLEPMIMVVRGGLVGGRVIGMYLPTFKLAATI